MDVVVLVKVSIFCCKSMYVVLMVIEAGIRYLYLRNIGSAQQKNSVTIRNRFLIKFLGGKPVKNRPNRFTNNGDMVDD